MKSARCILKALSSRLYHPDLPVYALTTGVGVAGAMVKGKKIVKLAEKNPEVLDHFARQPFKNSRGSFAMYVTLADSAKNGSAVSGTTSEQQIARNNHFS